MQQAWVPEGPEPGLSGNGMVMIWVGKAAKGHSEDFMEFLEATPTCREDAMWPGLCFLIPAPQCPLG